MESRSVRTGELLGAPSVQRAVESIERLIPGVCVWFLERQDGRVPVHHGSRAHCDRFPQLSGEERRAVLEGDWLPDDAPSGEAPLVKACCPGRFRALVPLRLRSVYLGTLGLCGLHDEEAVRHAARILLDMVRLLASLVEDHDNLELIHRLWDEMRPEFGMRPLLLDCLDQVLTAVGAERGAVFLFDDEGKAKLHEQRGLDPDRLEHGPLRYAVEDFDSFLRGRPMPPISVPREHPLSLWARSVAADGREAAALYVVPLSHGNGPLGFVLLLLPGPMPDGLDRPAFRVLLEGIGSAINNLLALEGARDRSQALATIHAIHRLVSTSERKGDFLDRLSRLLADRFRVEKCGFMLWDPRKGLLVPAGSTGLEQGEIGTRPVAPGEGLIGKAAATYEAQQLLRSARTPECPEAVRPEYRAAAYLSVPLVRDDLVAVMTLGSDTRDFSVSDRQAAFILAEQIAIALQLVELSPGKGA